MSAAELQEMIAACQKNRVQFMDGVMFMHSPRLARVREVLDDGKSVGPVRRISSAFSFYRRRGFFPRQHPRGWPARTHRLPGGPRLVLPPVRALDDELATAAHGHRTHPLAIRRRFRPRAGADGIVRRTVF